MPRKDNPFQPPKAAVADIAAARLGAFQQPRLWSPQGRIGRLRYLCYITVAYLLFGLFFGLGIAFGSLIGLTFETSIGAAELLGSVPFCVFVVLTSIKRSHDMGWSGWTVLLMIIPLAGFIWVFKGGSDGANRYGLPPPPNTTGIRIGGFAFPALFVVGILAYLVLPGYNQFRSYQLTREAVRNVQVPQPAAQEQQQRQQ